MDELVTVYFYSCSCDWISKYCDEEHRRSAQIPWTVLNEYRSDSE